MMLALSDYMLQCSSTHFSALEAKIYLCGGSESEDSLVCAEGFYVFTPSNETWQELRTTGPAPKAQSSSCVLHENKLITFGGIEKGKAQNYLHSLDLSEFSANNYPPLTGLQPSQAP